MHDDVTQESAGGEAREPVKAIDRRRFLQLGGAAALAAGGASVLAGASPSSAEGRLSVRRAGETRGPAASAKGVLNLAIPGDPLSLDPVKYNEPGVLLVYTSVMESLYKFDTKHNLVPVLASGPPKANSGYTRWTIPIRSGVRFHNGKLLTAQDVKFTIEQIVNPKSASNNAAGFSGLKSVEAPNDSTVVFNMKYKDRYFPQFALIQTKIVPSNVRYTPTTYASKLIGTGPFKFGQWVHGQKIVMTRNADYWNKPEPYLAGVVYQIIPSQEGQLAGLVNGSIQMLPNLAPADAALVRSRGQRLYAPTTVNGIDWLWPNWQSGHPTANVNMRLAIAYAINRKRIVEQVYKGLASPESTIPAFGSLGYSKTIGQSIPAAGDPAAAKRYLRLAGGAPKSPLVFVVSSDYLLAGTESQLIEEDLAAIGLQTTIQQESTGSAVSALVAGNYDLWFVVEFVTPAPIQPQLLDAVGSLLNYNHVDNARLSALAGEAANNIGAVPQVQRQALAVMPQIPLVTYPSIFGLAKSVTGFVATDGGSDVTGLNATRMG